MKRETILALQIFNKIMSSPHELSTITESRLVQDITKSCVGNNEIALSLLRCSNQSNKVLFPQAKDATLELI